MKKLILLSREDLNEVDAVYLNRKKNEGFIFIAIDSPGIGLLTNEKLPAIIIDELIGNDSLMKARKEASKLEREWFLPVQHILSSNSICWPKFDREAIYWAWRDITIAHQIANKLNKDNDTILQIAAKQPPLPGLYYYHSDICAVILNGLLNNNLIKIEIFDNKTSHIKNTQLICPAIKFEDSHCGTPLSSIRDKIVLVSNPGEFHRFSPAIQSLSKQQRARIRLPDEKGAV